MINSVSSNAFKVAMGEKKPVNEQESMLAASSLMWKKVLDSAMSNHLEETQDSNPMKEYIQDQKTKWMAASAAVSFQDSWMRTLLQSAKKDESAG